MSAHSDDLVTQTAAFLFWDTVGSTAMLEELGEERTERLRRRLFESVRDVVAANRGQVVKSTGDGMMVAFPSALADALTCAVGIQRVVAVLRPHVDGAQLEVRVGVQPGDAVRSWDERDWYGASVNTAARCARRRGRFGCDPRHRCALRYGWLADRRRGRHDVEGLRRTSLGGRRTVARGIGWCAGLDAAIASAPRRARIHRSH